VEKNVGGSIARPRSARSWQLAGGSINVSINQRRGVMAAASSYHRQRRGAGVSQRNKRWLTKIYRRINNEICEMAAAWRNGRNKQWRGAWRGAKRKFGIIGVSSA
jgi:hypothetical protein